MVCPVHRREMNQITEIPPSWVYEGLEHTRGRYRTKRGQRRQRTILRCGIKDCPQVGFEFDAEDVEIYRCSKCGRRMSNRQNIGIDHRCSECRKASRER